MPKLEQIDIQFYLEDRFTNATDLIPVVSPSLYLGLDLDIAVFEWILNNA